MTFSLRVLPAAAIAAAAIIASAMTPAEALTAKECSAKYKAAKESNTLGGMKWNDFRKAHCAEGPAAAQPGAKPAMTKLADSKAVFPSAIDSKYAKETPGRARMHTCRDQYRANKAKDANGGMKWIMKGGGYYSLCNKALKG